MVWKSLRIRMGRIRISMPVSKAKNLRRFAKKNSVNLIIIGVSIFSSLLFLDLSTGATDVWRDLLVNLSASMLAIGITVILVDILRERRLESQFKIPRSVAVKKILGANSVLALNLAINYRSKDSAILSGMLRIVKENKDSEFALSDGAKETLLKLEEISAEDIVSSYSDEQLTEEFLQIIQNIRQTYTDTSDKYIFSFSDPVMRSDYTKLLESLDGIIGAIALLKISGEELEQYLVARDGNDSRPMSRNYFIGVVLNGYIKSLNSFLETYI